MAERRSGRLRKSINYARFGGEEEDDDDFQSTKTREKRSKISHEKSNKKKAVSSPNSSSQSINMSPLENEKLCKRPSLDDKIFQRQLKVVLEKSVIEADSATDKNSLKNTADAIEENTDFCYEQKRASPSSAGSRILKEIPRISPSKTADDCTELIADDQEQESEDIPERPPAVARRLMPMPQTSVKRAKCTSLRNSSVSKGPDISLISPVKKSSISLLSYKGLKLGLSRKVPIKPLHTGVIKLT